jgi:hypothetical protein
MLTQKTAAALYNCHQQIINAEKLLTETRKIVDREETTLRDAFGRNVGTLELGVPSGGGGHRIFNVDFDLAAIIIEGQVEKYKIQLKALNELAKSECLSVEVIDESVVQ